MSQFVQFLDDQDVTGAIVITVAAIVAMVAVTGTLLHMFLVLTIPTYARGMSSAQERNFITSPLGFYIICLLASYFISAVGGVMESQWIGARAITEGPHLHYSWETTLPHCGPP
ncbi:hypothetical protein K439DRAFT_747958 [Ramaria rubella]|nr:hypothetical protein K439DRAFT_747958 [Ramaria rubella]